MSRAARPRAHWSTRAFCALLGLYPTEFRDEYGRELALVFADRYRDAASAWSRAGLWLDALHGIVTEAPKEHVHMLRQDLRHAFRAFVQKPLFALTVVATLALGIGANTGVFQLIEAVGLRNLPVRNPGELVEVRIAGGNQGFGINPGRYGQLTEPVWHEIRANQRALSGAFAWTAETARIGEDTELRRASGLYVSGEFFDVLGVQPARGRLLTRGDEASTCPAATGVVSHAYWQREMGGRELDGHTRLRVNGQSLAIVGVTQAGFTGLAVGESFDVAVPLCRRKEWRREVFNVAVMGRLRPGDTIERASAHLDALSAGVFAATAPTGYNTRAIERFKAFRLAAYPASAGVSALRSQYDRSLWLLLAMTGLVLLIACANLANLMLARATTREREVAVRQALGASRLVLVRQLLTESAVLAAGGAALGIALAQAMSRVLVWALSTQSESPTLALTTNWRVLSFTAIVAAVTCIIFGVAPAVRATRVPPTAAMGAGRGMTADRRRLFTQRAMVVTQIAVSLVLLVGALLFVRSFRNLMTFDPGMRQDDITVAFFGYGRVDLPAEQLSDYRRALVDEVRSLPGVIGAATTTNIPLLGGSWGHGVRVDAVDASAKFTWVSPGYFEVMGIPLVRGRDLTRLDTRTSTRVAVVNQAFVRQFIGSGNPLGRTLQTAAEPQYPSTVYEIVGVIPDTQYSDYRGEKPPMVFAPDSQFPGLGRWATMMIHSPGDAAALTAAIKRRMAQTRPSLIFETMPFRASIRDGLVRERLLAMLSAFFGVLAALLAVIGLYGMMSYAMAQRRQEIGVRVALGASRGDVVAMVMRDACRLIVVGVVAGAVLSLAASSGAASLLFGLTPSDPSTLAAAAGLLVLIAAAAAFVPARRAARLDPLSALRQE